MRRLSPFPCTVIRPSSRARSRTRNPINSDTRRPAPYSVSNIAESRIAFGCASDESAPTVSSICSISAYVRTSGSDLPNRGASSRSVGSSPRCPSSTRNAK